MYIASIGSGAAYGDNNLSGTYALLDTTEFPTNVLNEEKYKIDTAGNVYILDQTCRNLYESLLPHCKIKKYAPDGTWIYTLGSGNYGTGNFLSGTGADFAYINNYKIDSNQNLYISTSYGDDSIFQLHKYSSTGAWLMTLGNDSTIGENNLSGTSALFKGHRSILEYIDSVGNLYIADGYADTYWGMNRKIRKYSST